MNKIKYTVDRIFDGNKVEVGDQIDYDIYNADDNEVTIELGTRRIFLKKTESNKIGAGVFKLHKISYSEIEHQPVTLTEDKILEVGSEFSSVTNGIDTFLEQLHAYKEMGIQVPKRGFLVYGPPGSGKTTGIITVIKKYLDANTLVMIWPSGNIEASSVSDYLKDVDYTIVKRILLVIEDLGGVEIADKDFAASEDLLSLLDNQVQTFKCPTVIIGTTNFPENFVSAVANRPGRFDEKIQVGYPSAEWRASMVRLLNPNLTDEECELVKNKKCDKLTPAHLKEAVIRNRIYKKPFSEALQSVVDDVKAYEAAFKEAKERMGF